MWIDRLRENACWGSRAFTEQGSSGFEIVFYPKAVLLHGRSGQSMFEMHIHKVKLTQEALISLASLEPNLFATWTFYDHDLQV